MRIFLVDHPGRRDPLQTEYYRVLGLVVSLVQTVNIHNPIHPVLERFDLNFNWRPDYVMWGFQLGDALEQSRDELNQMEVPIILNIGDVRQFCHSPRYTEQFWGLDHIKYLVYKQRRTGREDPHLEALEHFRDSGYISHGITEERYGTRTETFLQDSEIIHVPWGIAGGPCPPDEGRHGIGMFCSIHEDKNHEKRKLWMRYVRDMPDSTAETDVFGAHYRLHDFSVAVVETAMSGIVTQKYLEAAEAGCLLYGEVPYNDRDTFEGSMVEWDAGPAVDLSGYLCDGVLTEKGKKLRDKGRKKILQKYSMTNAVTAFTTQVEGFL